MNTNKLIVAIALAFSVMVSVPRMLFLLRGGRVNAILDFSGVTYKDTFVRLIVLLAYSVLTLMLNTVWIESLRKSCRIWVAVAINALLFFVWQLLIYAISSNVDGVFVDSGSSRIHVIVYLFFLLVLLLVSFSIRLIQKSKRDSVEREVLVQKNLQNELEALKNQINPHFLFNSLNTLSVLVREDQKSAVRFINKLSFLYRYILQSQEKELVTVKEELKVLESYVHLIGQRYKENFKAEISIGDHLLDKRIPILALQLLMENVVKHNEISNRNPMLAEVYGEENRIVIKNKLQPRTGYIESTNTGLKNLNTRVRINMGEELHILKNDTHFIVKIPTK